MASARGQTLGTAKNDVKTIGLNLRADGEQTVTVQLNVLEDGQQQPVVVNAKLKPGAAFKWVDFKLPVPLKPGVKYLVWVPATKHLFWRLYEHANGERLYGKVGDWTKVSGAYALRPLATPRKLGKTAPECAVDGFAWPMGDECHQWRSEPAKGLPQWIEIDFGKPQKLNTVYLTWDSNIFGRFPTTHAGAEVTAQDYRLLYNTDGLWRAAFEEKDNWRRFRKHSFGEITTDKIRLEIRNAINGDEARLYQIRAYRE
ncbi:MAG: discoidin domain-containing protein, partial [Kiritimatiellaeota bacterium]|nr:discoidin domain-containing protein [Kiritimatiellota bacterium]